MVKQNAVLDRTFSSLSDPTRRDILRRISVKELSVSEIAAPYEVSFAAISKHIKVLENAELIIKHKRGKQHFIELSPPALAKADEYLEQYRKMWEDRMDRLEEFLKNN